MTRGLPLLDETARERRVRRWAWKHGGMKRLGADTLAFVGMLLNDPCSYCGTRTFRIDIDHIQASALGGFHTWENLTAACICCNSSKHRRSVLDMALDMGQAELRRHSITPEERAFIEEIVAEMRRTDAERAQHQEVSR